MAIFNITKKKLIKILIILLEIFTIGLIIYLVALPFFPNIKYKINYNKKSENINWKDEKIIKQKIDKIINNFSINLNNKKNNFIQSFPKTKYSVSQNRIIIPKIGVNAPIVESKNSEYGLSKGSWRVPESSTPNKGGNTVITGHRFKYLPPNNLTFYLFDKLEIGDIVSVIWEEKNYYYKIKETKIIKPTDLSILEPTKESILTMFTCDPIYSQKNRLVIISQLLVE